MTILNFMKSFDDFVKDPKKLLLFFRQNLVAFILAILVFILLYVYIAESGRRKALQRQSDDYQHHIKRLEQEVIQTKTDFFDLQNQIKQNDSIFYNRDIDLFLDVNTLLNRMSNRFETDGISAVSDDRRR